MERQPVCLWQNKSNHFQHSQIDPRVAAPLVTRTSSSNSLLSARACWLSLVLVPFEVYITLAYPNPCLEWKWLYIFLRACASTTCVRLDHLLAYSKSVSNLDSFVAIIITCVATGGNDMHCSTFLTMRLLCQLVTARLQFSVRFKSPNTLFTALAQKWLG